jgi:hypothetical protein
MMDFGGKVVLIVDYKNQFSIVVDRRGSWRLAGGPSG